jgi:hypothetical protein
VSTGNAACPCACTITTLAVLWPTPGSASSASKLSGTRPPCCSIRIFERPAIALALAGERPQGRITRWISATGSFSIASGVAARANSSGVT